MYLTYLAEATREALEDTLHVATVLHGDEAGVVLLIDPNKKVLGVVVPKLNNPSRHFKNDFCWLVSDNLSLNP